MVTTLEPDFATVIERARAGDEAAWATIHASLAGPLRGYLRGAGASDPDDLLGEVFCDLARGIGRFAGNEGAFRGWAFLVARHRIIDERRRRRRRPVDPVDPVDPGAGGGLAATPADTDVEAEALARVGDPRLRRLLDALTPDQRDVLLLRVVADLPVEDVARMLGKRKGAIKQMQHRALATLRRLAAAEGVTG